MIFCIWFIKKKYAFNDIIHSYILKRLLIYTENISELFKCVYYIILSYYNHKMKNVRNKSLS